MTDEQLSPFSKQLLNQAPTQNKMRQAEQALKTSQAKQIKHQQSQASKATQAAQIAKVGKPLWWLVFMFVCSVLYLFPEAVFNAALTDVAGGKSSTDDELRAIELFGRAISGIGVTLLLADLLLKGRLLTSAVKAIGCLLLIGVIVWPTVFFGQKWLVDHYIVDASTGAERQRAYLSQVIRRALIEKSVEIEGIHYQPDQPHSGVEKTFLSVFGGLVYADDQVIATLEQQKRQIMERFVRDHAMSGFDQHYAQYDQFRKTLKGHYTTYATKSNQYNDAIAGSSRRSDQYWLDTQNEIKKGWTKYKKGLTAYEARVEARAQKIAPKVFDYFKRRQKCATYSSNSSKNRCYQRLQKGYDKEIKKYGIGYIPADDWLKREEISTASNIGSSLLTGVLTGGLSTVLQAANAAMGGDGGFKDHRMIFTNDVNHYKAILMVKMAGSFVKSSGGYPLGISSIHQFRHHKVTAKKVRKSLNSKGLKLPSSWTLAQRATFNRAVLTKVTAQAKAKWRSGMQARGSNIGPNLSWRKFQLHSEIQARLADQMAELYVKPMLADWNNRQFKQRVIDVNIKRKTNEYLKVMNAQIVEFEDGGSFGSTGKAALRGIIIPPISMSISLMLVLLTLLKLPIKAVELVKAKRVTQEVTPVKTKGYISALISGALIAVIVALPLLVGGNKFTQSGSAVNYFLVQMDKNDSALVSFSLKWLLTTQPLVQPTGLAIDNLLGITTAFNAFSEPLNKFDQRFFAEHETSELAGKSLGKSSNNTLPLTITTNVKGAKVFIMNIKPKYSAGMMLPKGAYDIKVVKSGYQSVRKWIYLKERQSSFTINL